MASKSGQQEPEKAEVIEELLDALDTTLDRVKVLYEQFFLGIQKQPPTYLHTDIERKIRDLAQIQIRNTALRYRFVTLQQKFGSYNSYWRRTLRQIENGTYTRNLFKIGRQAARTGAAVPEEILAAMPKRMREQVVRDREAALAMARLRERQSQERSPGPGPSQSQGDEILTLADEDIEIDVGDLGLEDLDPAAFVRESSDLRRNVLTAAGPHRVDDSDAEFDVDAFFASVIREDDDPTAGAPSAPGAAGATRASRPPSRPPAVSRTRTGHPMPASLSGSPDAAVPPSSLSSLAASAAPSAVAGRAGTEAGQGTEPRQPSKVVAPVRGTGAAPAVAPPAAAPVRITGAGRAVAPPASAEAAPGAEARAAAPARDTGSARAVTPPASAVDESTAGPRTAAPAGGTGAARAVASPPSVPVPTLPRVPRPAPAAARPEAPRPAAPEAPRPAIPAPSQATKPLRVAPGSAAARAPASVETLAGPFPRIPSPPSRGASRASPASSDPDPVAPIQPTAAPPPDRPSPTPKPARPAPDESPAPSSGVPELPAAAAAPSSRRPPAAARPAPPERAPSTPRAASPRPASEREAPEPRQAPPAGMSDADVNALYTKYVKAKQILGEEADPGTYGKLLKTINAQAPKIMEQYKSKGVDFSVVVKDNQVIIRAKPKP